MCAVCHLSRLYIMTNSKKTEKIGVAPFYLNSTLAAENAKTLENYLDLADTGMCSLAFKELVLLAKTHKIPKLYRQELILVMQFLDDLNHNSNFFINPKDVEAQEEVLGKK